MNSLITATPLNSDTISIYYDKLKSFVPHSKQTVFNLLKPSGYFTFHQV